MRFGLVRLVYEPFVGSEMLNAEMAAFGIFLAMMEAIHFAASNLRETSSQFTVFHHAAM